jgi:signal transduction histidine kinase/ligand-binding sensor domain-containing protein/CheY-like chemotaxis protein
MRARLFGCILAALVAAGPARALDPARPLALYALDVWRDGLPQYTVQTLAQTPDGYLWFGTFEGLVRFNGLQFEVFDPQNTPALRSARIRALLVDRSGTLWIGTGGGVVQYRDRAFHRFEGVKGDNVGAIVQTADGGIRIGTNAGVTRVRDGRISHLPLPGPAQAIAEGRDGTLWIGSDAGLFRSDGRSVTPVPVAGRSPAVSSILIAADGAMWIGTLKDGVFRVPRGGVAESLHAQVPTAYAASVIEDSKGTIWIAASPGGLIRFRDGRFETLDKAQGLPNTSVRSLFEDREGDLWIGTNGGLARLEDRKFVTYTARNGLTDDNTRVVAEAKSGGLWIGTYGGGVNRVEGDKVTAAYGTAQGLEYIRTMVEEPDGLTLWVGSSQGLASIRDGRVTMFAKREGLAGDRVDALQIVRDGTLLVSTGSLQTFRDGRFAPYLAEVIPSAVEGPGRDGGAPIAPSAHPGPSTTLGMTTDPRLKDVRVILEDRGGSVWLGTAAGVLELRDRRIVRAFTTRDGLPSNTVFALHEDRGGDLWIGTHEGLARLRGGKIAAVTTAQGLPWNVVFQILEDGRGHVWLTSNRGLTRVDLRSIEDVLAGRAARVQALSFGKSDGMGSDQCNGATQPAGVRLRDGRLAIPTVAGLSIIDPADLHLNRVPPTVVLREVLVDGKPFDLRHSTLPWSASRYEFHYDGISLLAPELVHFRYRMDGFDRQWVDAGTRRVAFYNSLSPGPHRLHVMAINNDGVRSVGDESIAFDVPAAPWQRWWAMLLYLAAAIGVVALAIHIRERAARRKTALLEAMVHERTIELERAEARAVEANRAKSVFLANMSHELRTPLNAVIGFAQLMSRSASLTATDREKIDVIRRSGEHLLGLINDVLSISKIESGKLTLNRSVFHPREVVSDIAEMIRGRAEAAGLDLVIDIDAAFPNAVSGDEGKLRQILVNLLGNAVKFTRHGQVTMRARWRDGRAEFEINDTGVGISDEEIETLFQPFVQTHSGRHSTEGTGLGLAITRKLVQLMGGDITVQSRENVGTTFRFEIDLPRSQESALRRQHRRVIALASPATAPRIAVVDDAAVNRALLAGLLETVGFEVAEATNGREAVELWKSWSPDVVFMDQRMPVLDGAKATRMIREAEAAGGGGRRTVIVAVTASAFEHEREELLTSGADEVLVKPWAEENIFGVIARELGVTFIYEGDAQPAKAV